MDEKQMLELILSEILEMKTVQQQHSEQFTTINSKLNSITEQLGKVSEVEPIVRKLIKDVERLETDVSIIKKAIAN